ncbi:hypothetical protein IWX49DRAFT_550176 [Phyllosticta citricarpa]|uniref:Uncharacterized protein n=1 Tax=Phyllosticta citricarpa TaxID=55181 RepID=A0ABR1MMN2_9PEZI
MPRPEITYVGMVENAGGGWKTSYRVQVHREDSLSNADYNGPFRGRNECLLGCRLDVRNGMEYGSELPLNDDGHQCFIHNRPPKIRIWRALHFYSPENLPGLSPSVLTANPGNALPQWARDECEMLEFEMSYYDQTGTLSSAVRPLELFIPIGAAAPVMLWIYRLLPKLGSRGTPVIIN